MVAGARVETIQFQYTHGEYARALRRYRVRYFRLGRDLSFCALLAVAAYFLRNQGWPFWLAVGVGALYLLIIALSVGLYPALAPRLRPHLEEPYALAFSELEVAFSTPSTESRLPWSIYKAWSRDTDYVYLSLGRGHATILPRRALGGPGTESALFQLFTQKLGPERAAA